MIFYNRPLLLSLLILLFASCDDFLDRAPNIALSEEAVFTKYDNAVKYHNDIYSHLKSGYNVLNGAQKMPLACVSDEADSYAESNTGVSSIENGNYFGIDNQLPNSYKGIRKANTFISKLDVIPFPNDDAKNSMTGEAYFLRAHYFNEIVKRHGGLQIFTEENILIPGDELIAARNTYQESVDQVLADLDIAIPLLPLTRSDVELGRITRGAAMGLKARVLLYAASPLWQNDYTDPQGHDTWQLAADAAKAVIDLKDGGVPVYELFTQTADGKTGIEAWERLFFTRRESNTGNKEVIFHKHHASQGWNSAQISLWAPLGEGIDGAGMVTPLQNFVDLFEMADGRPGTDADPSNPYANREPRFYKTILYNGSSWQDATIETFVGGKHNKDSGTYPQTGYYIRKMLPEEVKYNTPVTATHDWIYIRLADMYLSYAEALNEVEGATAAVYDAVNTIRRRVGHVDLPTNLSQDEMRSRIWNERAIELSFEEQRWFDARRWKKASDWFDGNMYKMKITVEGDTTSYSKEILQQRVCKEYMNLYPISLSEMKKNPKLIQNPGW